MAKRNENHAPGAKRLRRQQEILTAATELFTTKGYEKTTIEDIADEVGVLKGSLYYYFASKEELLFEVVSANHESLHRHVVTDADYTSVQGLDTVRLFTSRHVRFVLTHRAVSSLYSQEFDVVRSVETWWHSLSRARRDHENVLVELIRQAQASGVASDQLDPVLSGRAILSMANSTVRWFRPDGPSEIEEVVSHHTTLAANGIRA
ncbi:MAG: TetR/AcrR family transcriptional regulator [Subtercola sp.]|nr:TetR/AcrR family transcriptional regulator [Subtercola sp.]